MFSILRKISSTVSGFLEGFFFWYGFKVGQYPWYFACGCLLFSGLCGIGLINYTEELNAFRLWIPDDSSFVGNYQWLLKNYPPNIRYHNVIMASSTNPGEDILEPKALQLLAKIHQGVKEIVAEPFNKTWESGLCKKIPIPPSLPGTKIDTVLDCDTAPPPLPDISNYVQWMNICNHTAFCDLVDQMEFSQVCLENSLLELWQYDTDLISTLSKQDILDKLNSAELIGTFGPVNLDSYMTAIRSDDGSIKGASSVTITWYGQTDLDAITEEDLAAAEDGIAADATTLDFEAKLRDFLLEFGASQVEAEGFSLFVTVARGYADVAREEITGDAYLLPVGFMAVTTYAVVMLGHLTCVENRALLTSVGMAIIGLTILVTYGLCSALGLFFGPMHNAIPFLFLGIGIDDMFVIVQSLDNLGPKERQPNNIPQNIGQTMKHAGVAITVTSITDIVVFAVGSSTKLPALRSFCLYCAVGIFVVYVFQATLFVACVALDLRRLEQNRNGFIACYKHKNATAKPSDKVDLRKRIFKRIGEFLNSVYGKVVVFVATFTLLGFAIWGLTELETKFESSWFLPQESYIGQWEKASAEYFSKAGERVTVYVSDVNYSSDISKLGHFVTKLEEEKSIVSAVNTFYPSFHDYVSKYYAIQINNATLSENEVHKLLWTFLSSIDGFRFQPAFDLGQNFSCREPIENIKLTTLDFVHQRFNTTSEHLDGMTAIYNWIDELKFSNNVFPLTQEYANWETELVIKNELFRNVGLSMLCVFVTMLLLLADIWASILVMVCVLMTLIDVMGYMHFWGLTIDVVSSIIIIISIGLCVDYAAHIAHAFLTSKGSRSQRSILAIQNIGPAVLNGGISTFLALVLLAASESYVFSTFFKVFTLVIFCGLYHGLVFFPALLGLIGPPAYQHDDGIEDNAIKANEAKENSTKL